MSIVRKASEKRISQSFKATEFSVIKMMMLMFNDSCIIGIAYFLPEATTEIPLTMHMICAYEYYSLSILSTIK